MKKQYTLSRIIIGVLVTIVTFIASINEDSSWMFIPLVSGLIAFGLSFPSTIFCKNLLKDSRTKDYNDWILSNGFKISKKNNHKIIIFEYEKSDYENS